ncbi:hypothetical protein TESS_TESS_00062 [Tessaracoccus sp. O5.2]|uniref:DUF4235 domain-containing protein n=1 Tax=Tessaracoccus sp. O5.2 TaxID=3157622 RepID=UPI0035EC1E35
MALTEKVMWKIYAGVLGALTTLIARKLVTKTWEAATGDPAPDINDPETPVASAIIWAAASGLGVGISQLVMNRYMQRRWMANFAHVGPSRLRTKLDF